MRARFDLFFWGYTGLFACENTPLAAYSAVLGSCAFLIIVSPVHTGKTVLRLEYEAYVPMALKEMRKLAIQMRIKWPQIGRIAIAHRVGVGTWLSRASLVVCCLVFVWSILASSPSVSPSHILTHTHTHTH
jgi:MoaE protein